jgi:peptidoglycan/LPS O-acetylase OafA/YrhL
MIVSISNPIEATVIFSVIFFLIILATVKPRVISEWLPASLSAELKGVAILMIVLSHIGYYLVNDTHFLWPLSIMAGVGVNLFLFLSGYGLTVSQLKKNLSLSEFYQHRLLKIFIPYWLLLLVMVPLDIFLLKINYAGPFMVRAAVGIITHADLYADFNSPLWYFTFIIGYYLLFPLVFSQKRPWLSAVILTALGFGLVAWSPDFLENVLYLYRVHVLAFPLGVLAAWAVTKLPRPEFLAAKIRGRQAVAYGLILVLAVAVFVYANVYSGVGGNYQIEQLMSLLAGAALLIIFLLKKWESRALYWVGVYSYEIYLWHWPLMYRYDIFYRLMPVWLATILYLLFFAFFGWLLSKLADWLNMKIMARPAKVVVNPQVNTK